MRDSAVIYRSFFDAIKELPEQNQSELWMTIFEYVFESKQKELSGINKTVFTLIKPQLDANNSRYENGKKYGHLGADHGKKGGRPKKEKNKKTPNRDINKTLKKPSNDNVNENVNENENVNGRAHAFAEQPVSTSFLPPSQAQCEEFFNGVGLPHLGQKFFLHYKSTGWDGVRDWLARAQRWALDESNKLKPNETLTIHKPK